MPWQTNTETGRICAIAYGSENATKPTAPNTGTSIDWTATASGEAAEGWTLAMDNTTATVARFSADDFSFNDAEGNEIVVKAPTATQKDAIIQDQPQLLDNITFTSYEAGAKIMDWATDWSSSSQVYTPGVHSTRRAIVIEVEGFGFHYMPSCEVHVGTHGGGSQGLAQSPVTIRVFRGSSVTTGYDWNQYADS